MAHHSFHPQSKEPSRHTLKEVQYFPFGLVVKIGKDKIILMAPGSVLYLEQEELGGSHLPT